MHDRIEDQRPTSRTMVHVLEINHRHGTDLGAYRTPEGVWQALAEYVRGCWAEVEADAGPIDGLTDDEAIDAYFEAYSWHSEPETYEVWDLPVRG